MATLFFRVDAEYDEAIKCKKEIDSLTKALEKVSTTGTQREIEALETRLQTARTKFAQLIDTAEKSGADLERDFNKNMRNLAVGIVEASNEFQKQKKIVADLKKEIASYEDQLIEAIQKGDEARKASLKKTLAEKNAQLGIANNAMLGAVDRSSELDAQAKRLRTEYELINSLDNMLDANGANAIAEAFGLASNNGNTFLGILNQIGTQATGVAVGNLLSNGMMGALDMAINFKNNIFETRKYFQDVESSMKIFLGDAEKATEFTDKLQEYAYYNMFDYEQLVGASKQLIAYGNDVENVIPILDKLSEIATGTGNSVEGLVSMYNRAKSIGYVDSRTLMAWASQGIVVKDILKEMGETGIGARVTFEQLDRALDYVTRKGGMFGGVMNAQMDNLSASMGQLEDNLSLMRNEIGQNIEPLLKGQIDLQAKLVDNWKTVAKVIGGIAVTYGVLKAALATNIVLRKLENALLTEAITLRKKNVISVNAEAVSMKRLTLGLKAYTAQAWEAAKATLANPYTWVAVAIATATAAIWAHVTALNEEERASRNVDEALEKRGELLKQQREEEEQLAETIGNVNRSEREKLQAYEKLSQTLPELTKKYNEYQLSQMSPEERKRVVEQAQQEQDNTNRDTAIKEAQKVIDEDVARARNWKGQLIDAVTGGGNSLLHYAREWADNTDNDLASFIKKIDVVRGLSDEYLTGEYDWNLYEYDEEQAKKIDEAYQKIADTQKIAKEERKTDTREQLNFIADLNKRLEEEKKKEEEEAEALRRKKLALKEQLVLEEQDLASVNKHREHVNGLIEELKTLENTQELYDEIESVLENAPKGIKFEPGMPKEQLAKVLVDYLDSVNQEVDKKKGKVDAVNTEIKAIAEQTPSALRKNALHNRILIESVQRKLAYGNYNFTDEELKACGVDIKEIDGKKTYTGESEFAQKMLKAKNNGGIDAGDRDTLKEKVNTELQNIKGDQETAGQSIIDKDNQIAYKLSELHRKNAQEYSRQAQDAVYAATQAEIDAMYEGYEKKNAQRKLDHQKEMERIRREKEDKIRAAEEKARAEWMAENPDYNKEYNWKGSRDKYLKNNAEYQSAVATAVSNYATAMGKEDVKFANGIALVNQYTSALEKAKEGTRKYMDEYRQLTSYMVNLDMTSDEYKRALDAREELTRQHILGLTKDYESYDVNRINLEQKYADKKKEILSQISILQNQSNASSDEEYKRSLDNQISLLNLTLREVGAKQGEELAKLQSEQMKKSLEKLKQDPTYFMAFRDMTNVSSDALSGLMAKLDGLSGELSNLDPKDLETITNLMGKIDEELIKRDPTGTLKKLNEELKAVTKEQEIASRELANAKLEDVNASLALADANIALISAERAGTTKDKEDAQKAYSEAQERANKAAERLANAQNKVNNLTIRQNSITSTIDKATDSIRGKIVEIGDLLDKIGQQVSGKIGEIMQDVSSILNDLMKVADLYKKYKDAEALSKAQSNVSNNIGEIGKGVKSAKDAKGGSGAMATGAAILQGVQLGISVGNSLTSIISKAGFTADAKHEKYARKIAEINKLTKSVNDYAYAALKARHIDEDWFGGSAIQGMQDSWQEASLAQKNYFAKLNERQAAYRNQSRKDGDWLGHVIAGSVTGALIGSIAGPWGAVIGGVIGGAAGAVTSAGQQALSNSQIDKQTKAAKDNLRIETRHRRKSFMGIGGRNQRSQDLVTWAKEKYGADLFDAEGWINIQLYDQIKEDFGNKLLGETEKTLDELKDLKEKYDEYQEQLKEYVSNLYQPLAKNMTDALWEWFDSGKDALQSFKAYATDVFRSIMNDMMQQIVLSKVVGTFQDQIKGLYDSYFGNAITEEQLMSQVAMATDELMGRYEENIPILQDMMDNMSEIIEDRTGVIIHKGGGTGTTSGVSSSITQDSIDEANGRMTSIEMILQNQSISITELTSTTAAILYANQEGNNLSIGIHQKLVESYMELQGVHEDTSAIKTAINDMLNKYISKWDANIKAM